MRLRTIAAALGLLLVACSPELDWRELRSPEGGFSALMPARPRFEIRTLAGTPPVAMRLWSAQAADSVFGVGYVDYPAADGTVLDRTRDALLRNIRGNLLDERPLTQAGLTGRSFTAKGGDSLLRARLLVRGRRLYQIAVVGDRNALSDADADLFLSSFQVLGPRAADRQTR